MRIGDLAARLLWTNRAPLGVRPRVGVTATGVEGPACWGTIPLY